MNKTITVMAAIAGILAGASAGAQTPSPRSPGEVFLNVSVAGQPQTRTFTSSTTFSSFNETGRLDTSQNIGKAIVFDVTGGYQFGKHLGFGVGVWTARAKSAVAGTAIIPNPVFFGRLATITLSSTEPKQNAMGVNFQLLYTRPLTNRVDFTLSLGPSIVKVTQDVGTISLTPNTQDAKLVFVKQSKTSGKAGNLGLDLTYRLAEKYGVGVFVRYSGGEVDLPAVSKLKVGGLQAGGGIRIRF